MSFVNHVTQMDLFLLGVNFNYSVVHVSFYVSLNVYINVANGNHQM